MPVTSRIVTVSVVATALSTVAVLLLSSCGSSPTSPLEIGQLSLGAAYDVYVSGGTAFVSNNEGIAILDHPQNPRHPTHWMARGYGYCAACPFGLHSFDKEPLGTGDLTIAAGESVTFRYRLIFHEGSAPEANVEGLWQQYAKTPSSTTTR